MIDNYQVLYEKSPGVTNHFTVIYTLNNCFTVLINRFTVNMEI